MSKKKKKEGRAVVIRIYENQCRPETHAGRIILRETDCKERFPVEEYEQVRSVLEDRGYDVVRIDE